MALSTLLRLVILHRRYRIRLTEQPRPAALRLVKEQDHGATWRMHLNQTVINQEWDDIGRRQLLKIM